jgi:spermidine synthase
LLARADATPINVDELQKRLEQPRYARVLASLAEVEIKSASELLATYAGSAADLAPMVRDAQVNTDLGMRLQYLAGWGVNSVASPKLYREIVSYRRFPEKLLTGTGERMDVLRDILERPYRTF